jgi:nitroreductase
MSDVKQAALDHPIHELLAKRWSPCAFADRPVPVEDLRSLFEAARWAASSYNEQPWRYIVATKESPEEFERLLSCLVEGNQAWAKGAPVLALGCAALKFAHNNKPNAAALHDLGQASAALSVEATARGLFVHQMAGILPDKARQLYQIPVDSQALTGLAIGYLGSPDALPEAYRKRDLSPRQRKPLAEFIFGGQWGTTADLATAGAKSAP